MYESGFYFIDGPHNGTITYDIRLMEQLNNPSIVLKNIKKNNSQYITSFSHNLMYPKSIKIVAYTISNVFKEPHLVLNFFLPDKNIVESFVFDTKLYINRLSPNSLQISNSHCKELSIMLKNRLYSHKSLISGDSYHPHHLLALPLHILQLLCKYLDGRSFVRLMLSSKYLCDVFYKDETLWKFYSVNKFRNLNKQPNETWQAHYRYQSGKSNYRYPNRPILCHYLNGYDAV